MFRCSVSQLNVSCANPSSTRVQHCNTATAATGSNGYTYHQRQLCDPSFREQRQPHQVSTLGLFTLQVEDHWPLLKPRAPREPQTPQDSTVGFTFAW